MLDRKEPFTVEEVLVQEGSMLFHGAYDDEYLDADTKVILPYYAEVEGRNVAYSQDPNDSDYRGVLLPASWQEKLRQVIRLHKNPDQREADLIVHCHKLVPGLSYHGRFPIGLLISDGLVRTTGPTDMRNGVDTPMGDYMFETDPRGEQVDDLGILEPVPTAVIARVEHGDFGRFPYTREGVDEFAKAENMEVLDVSNSGTIVNRYRVD